MAAGRPRTLFEKIWDGHLAHRQDDGTCLLYVDLHLVHEVTSPQAFEGLRQAGRKVRRPKATLAVADHNVPTTDRSRGITEPESRNQVETLEVSRAGEHVYARLSTDPWACEVSKSAFDNVEKALGDL